MARLFRMAGIPCLLATICIMAAGCGTSKPVEVSTRPPVDDPTRVVMIAVRVPDGYGDRLLLGHDNWWRQTSLASYPHVAGAEMWALSDESRGKYFGRDDCSATLLFAHDSTHLYIFADVRDQALFNSTGPNNPNEGDDLELFIDANAPDKRFAETNNENTRQIMLVAGNVNPAWREPFIWQSDKTAVKPRATSRLTPHGYTMKIAIPKASFPYWKENPDLDAIGFDGLICDADAPGVDIHHPAQKGALFIGTHARHFMAPVHMSLLILERNKTAVTPLPSGLDFQPTLPAEGLLKQLRFLAVAEPTSKFIPAADLAHSHYSPLPPGPGSEALAQAVLDLIDDPRAGEVAAAAVMSRSHLVAKAGMLLLARRPNLPLPETLMENVKWLAARKDPHAVAAVTYAMEALAVRQQLPVQDMFALVKPADDASLSLTFMYCCGLNGDKTATPILLKILKEDPNFRMRMMAAMALGMLQDLTALDALQEATQDKNGDVRLQAKDAVQKLTAQ
ncbi:MAG: HEAT repeat domain-containing protein [Phycisphaerae bacterium]|nr:HEAT repeat domain-containing protein [Phycisphaerae bacterium]